MEDFSEAWAANQYSIKISRFFSARFFVQFLVVASCFLALSFPTVWSYRKYRDWMVCTVINDVNHGRHEQDTTFDLNPTCYRQFLKSTSGRKAMKSVQTYLDNKLANSSKSNDIENIFQCQLSENYELIFQASAYFEHFWEHFPHFSEAILRIYSVVLWQEKLFPRLKNDRVCMQKLSVGLESIDFWSKFLHKNGYNRQLSTHIADLLGVPIIEGRGCATKIAAAPPSKIIVPITREDRYFLHPLDALLLSSFILKLDPCRIFHSGIEVAIKPLNLLVVSRKNDRQIQNVEELMQFLFRQQIVDTNDVEMIAFEGKSFIQQATIMERTDLIIASHGAALNNLIFMKPCSIVIEFLPFLYNRGSYFERLAVSSDIIHLSTMQTPDQTIRKQHYWFPWSKCYKYLVKYSNMKEYDAEEIALECSSDDVCRHCARDAKYINIDLNILGKLLQEGIQRRRKCLLEHPIYSPKHNR